MIKIVTDSTCDLPPDFYKELDVTVVPINIQFGSETYLDGIEIDRETFYRKINEMGMIPTTSQPSVGQFLEVYEKLAREATDIISIHVTGKLSGTCRSAEMAAAEVADKVRVHVFDSLSGSAGLGYMVLEAARMARAGASVEQILERLRVLRDRMNIVILVVDLRFARMSGRVGKLQSALASLLNVKIIVTAEGGLLELKEKVRTTARAVDRMVEMFKEKLGTEAPVNLAVVHAQAPDEGLKLMERIKGLFNYREIFLTDLATSLAVHFGPGTLGLVGYRIP
ncbi:MAG: DegV family protein [Anaerolineae bacterium]|nr:DegV family protein [Anaerolineae bacterium]